MKRLIMLGLAAAFPLCAVAQDSKPEEAWKAAVKSAYFESKGESYAVLDDKTYAIGSASRELSAQTDGTYVFVKCGGMSGILALSTSEGQDAALLQRIRIVNPGNPEHATLTNAYKTGCWSASAWKNWGSDLLKTVMGKTE